MRDRANNSKIDVVKITDYQDTGNSLFSSASKSSFRETDTKQNMEQLRKSHYQQVMANDLKSGGDSPKSKVPHKDQPQFEVEEQVLRGRSFISLKQLQNSTKIDSEEGANI